MTMKITQSVNTTENLNANESVRLFFDEKDAATAIGWELPSVNLSANDVRAWEASQ